MDNSDFINILISNDDKEIMKYLTANGKKKPYSPIFFKENPNNKNQEDKQNE